MTLREAVDAYIAWRRAHGVKFVSGARTLRQFSRHAGDGIDCGSVGKSDVLGFLAGEGPPAPARSKKYSTLAGFHRHAVSRIMPRSRPGALISRAFLPPLSA